MAYSDESFVDESHSNNSHFSCVSHVYEYGNYVYKYNNTKPMIYLSGPYSTIYDNFKNIQHSRDENVQLAKNIFKNIISTGYWEAFCPHTHSNEMEVLAPNVSYYDWLHQNIKFLSICDAILVWKYDQNYSYGTLYELIWALMARKNVYCMPKFDTYPLPSDMPSNIDINVVICKNAEEKIFGNDKYKWYNFNELKFEKSMFDKVLENICEDINMCKIPNPYLFASDDNYVKPFSAYELKELCY